MNDPVQHAFEAESFEMERAVVSVAFGQEHVVDPDPQVAEYQRQRDKQQPQAGLARASENPRLPQLTKAGFDAEPLAVTLANLGRSPADAPGGEQQLLLPLFAILAVLVRAIA